MSESYKIEIARSKTKLFWMLFACVMFVSIGIAFILHPEKFRSLVARSTNFIFISGWLGVLFFGFVGLSILYRLKDKSPGLVISDQGITDHSSGVSAGFIPWGDVVAIRETEVRNQKFVAVIVKNPQTYVNRQKNAVKRKIAEGNWKIFGTAIGISANSLKINYDDLKKLLEMKFRQHTTEG